MKRQSWINSFLVIAMLAALLAMPLAAGAQQENGITTPAEGATVTGFINIEGYANDPNFFKWQIDLLPNKDPGSAIFLAVSEVPGEIVTEFESDLYPGGTHQLRLRVVRLDGNYDEYLTDVILENADVSATAEGLDDLLGHLDNEGAFKNFIVALTNANLAEGEGKHTVFAPTDAAFAALPEGTLESLLGDPDQLTRVLLYHETAGEIPSSDIKDGQTVTSEEGSMLTFSVDGDKIMVNDATVVSADNMTKNGIVHHIDTVLMPPADPEATQDVSQEGQEELMEDTDPMIETFDEEISAFGGPEGTVSGAVEIGGIALDTDFEKWDLLLFPDGDSNRQIWLATGEEPGLWEYELNTNRFPDGDYELVYRIVHNDSNYETFSSSFTIANNPSADESGS